MSCDLATTACAGRRLGGKHEAHTSMLTTPRVVAAMLACATAGDDGGPAVDTSTLQKPSFASSGADGQQRLGPDQSDINKGAR
jgi:hypothetical protein